MTEQKTSELRHGDRFRGLLIHGMLGKGAMGTAYLASHSVLRTPLVIKIFAPTTVLADAHGGVLLDPELFSEAHLAARVSSPHVVGVLDAGYEGELPFVIQRYVDGIDLDELIRRQRTCQRTLPTPVVVRLIADAARGLHAIHQAGVLHRDIKPANLFLGGSGSALVGDLGIAIDPQRVAQSQTIAGTPWFIAPEVWLGESSQPRSDIYSLGATAHLLATGTPPFEGSVGELARAHAFQVYVPPPTDSPAAAYLFAAIAAMMSKDAQRRPASALEVAQLLEPIAAAGPGYVVTSPTTAQLGALQLQLECGDIAAAEADVIVNAANWQLVMRVGVAAALAAAAGDELQQQALTFAPVTMGAVVWTGGGRLRCRWVAHAVSALAGAVCLQRCTLRVLLDAQARGARTIVFPALGTGVGEVPQPLAAKLMLEALRTFAGFGPSSVERVTVVLRDDAALECWARALRVV
jgi:eukaryotic-like serine/threonine-protein kinase